MRQWMAQGGRATLFLLAGFAAAPATAAAAAVKYAYVGKNYSYMYPSTGCLTTTMHMSIKLLLPKALAIGTPNQTVTPLSWSISDGLHSFSSSLKKPASPTPILTATFSTNAQGAITDWRIYSVYYFANTADFVEYSTTSSWNSTSKLGGDYGADYSCTTNVFTGEIASNGVPGHWVLK